VWIVGPALVFITEAGNHNRVAALVSISAFVPDKGESVSTLIGNPARGAPVPPILPPRDGFLFLDREKFGASFAGDLPGERAAFMADSQVPVWGVDALGGPPGPVAKGASPGRHCRRPSTVGWHEIGPILNLR
jgi:hypothetical protein